MTKISKTPFFAALLATTLIAGCVPVGIATGVGATAGIASAKEGGIRSAVTDTAIRARINDYWFKHDTEMFSKVKLTVDQGRVLLTGIVQKPEHRVEAVRLAWQAKGVKQVINEIQVGKSEGISGFANDKWITSQIRTQLIFNKYIQSINYSVDTVGSVVYLMGVAQSEKELQRAINVARKVKGVKQVVSYVKMVGEPIASTTGTSTAASSSVATQTYVDPGMVDTNMGATPIVPSKSDIQTETLPP